MNSFNLTADVICKTIATNFSVHFLDFILTDTDISSRVGQQNKLGFQETSTQGRISPLPLDTMLIMKDS